MFTILHFNSHKYVVLVDNIVILHSTTLPPPTHLQFHVLFVKSTPRTSSWEANCEVRSHWIYVYCQPFIWSGHPSLLKPHPLYRPSKRFISNETLWIVHIHYCKECCVCYKDVCPLFVNWCVNYWTPMFSKHLIVNDWCQR